MELLREYSKIDSFNLQENVFDLLKNEWMLITSGDRNSYNTMTAAWGGFGILWNKPIAVIFIRPQRHTFSFTEKFDSFSLSFFGHGNYRDELSFCGTKSGRDFDKAKETGLTPTITPLNNIAFQQARLIIDCKILYGDFIKPEFFFDNNIDQSVYPTKDYHKFYIADILGCYHLEQK